MVQSTRTRTVLAFAAILAVASLAVWRTTRGQEHTLRDIDGVAYGSLERPAHPEKRGWSVLFFLTPDCPIANRYAPEIQRICDKYGSNGANCFLVYADPLLSRDAIRKHARDYHKSRYPAILDSDYGLVDAAGATVSSEAAVFSSQGKLEYRGRIDDFNAALGVPRQQATQHDLRDALDAVIAGRSVPNPRTEPVGCFLPTRNSGAPS
jgi:hypothetical protein